ncbi:MAG TPA: DUF309 domain-containing protein [Candidatus Bathyarchaeia archaeon]|nr:DUF309 domain-containing protein [Candidatus Bathyarchaeia archaeon]
MIDLDSQRKLIEAHGYETITVRLLDEQPLPASRADILSEGVGLFNEERFWESHETLEQLWRVAKGREKDALQGIILTAAAFVHYQRGEDKICFSVLERARDKIPNVDIIGTIDLDWIRKSIDSILESRKIHPFRLRTGRG